MWGNKPRMLNKSSLLSFQRRRCLAPCSSPVPSHRLQQHFRSLRYQRRGQKGAVTAVQKRMAARMHKPHSLEGVWGLCLIGGVRSRAWPVLQPFSTPPSAAFSRPCHNSERQEGRRAWGSQESALSRHAAAPLLNGNSPRDGRFATSRPLLALSMTKIGATCLARKN